MLLIIFVFMITAVNYSCRACIPTQIAATGPTVVTATGVFTPTTTTTTTPAITTTTTTVAPVCAPTACDVNDLVDFSTTITGPTTDAATCVTTISVDCNPGFTMVRIRSGGTIIFVGPPAVLTCNEASGDFSYEFTPGTFSDVNSAFCM